MRKLINADEDDIALVESTTHGLNLVANAIPLQRGDRVVICDLEFLEVAVPWMQKRDELGIEIDSVPNRDGQILIEDIEAAIARAHPRCRHQLRAVEQRLSLRSRRALTTVPRARRLS